MESPSYQFFGGAYKLKYRHGLNFGDIIYDLHPPEKKSLLDPPGEEIGFELEHWKEDDKYYSQWILLEVGKEPKSFGEPYMSNVPIFEKDIERTKYLKGLIKTEYHGFDTSIVDVFLSEVTEYLNRFPETKLFLTKDLNKKDNQADDDAERFQLVYPTGHLKCFDDLVKATGLKGHQYNSIMKPVWYNLVSLLIAKTELQVGSIIVDGRVHILIFLPSGNGKGEIKKTIQRILKQMKISNIEPTSFHPEQFIGKVVVEKKKNDEGDDERDYRKIPGNLSLDYVIIDEGKDLLTSKEPNYSESRKNLRFAMDQYPNNTVTKRQVDVEIEHALSYEPHCGVCIFCQPFRMNEEFVLEGDLRRFILSYILMVGMDKTDAYAKRATEERNYKESIDNFRSFLSSTNVPDEFEVTAEAISLFIELHQLLVKRGSTRSIKIKNFMKMADFSLQNMLLKFSAIQALQDNTDIIETRHVELAFIDYAEILEHTYDYIEMKIPGDLDYGENWKGAGKKDQEILKWLHEKGSTSKKSSNVSIKEYKEKIMEIYNVSSDRQARRIKGKHVENGWIESQTIQHTSKVWLAFKPGDQTLDEVSRVRVETDITEKYLEIIRKYNLK